MIIVRLTKFLCIVTRCKITLLRYKFRLSNWVQIKRLYRFGCKLKIALHCKANDCFQAGAKSLNKQYRKQTIILSHEILLLSFFSEALISKTAKP